jgi:hypothetical protein
MLFEEESGNAEVQPATTINDPNHARGKLYYACGILYHAHGKPYRDPAILTMHAVLFTVVMVNFILHGALFTMHVVNFTVNAVLFTVHEVNLAVPR